MTAGTGTQVGFRLSYLPAVLLGLGVVADTLHRTWRAATEGAQQ